MDERQAKAVLHLPFVFVPHGAEVPAAWRAAHPDAVSLPARLVMPRGVQRVQFALPVPVPPLGMPGNPVDPSRRLASWLAERWPNILRSEPERWVKPPPGSKPISETPWSGNHTEIKRGIGAKARDDVRIAPDGSVGGENPDGSWTDHGPADDYIGSSRPAGQKGKDRERRRK